MARNKGTFQFAANFEVRAAEALDPRVVVSTKSELINKETWPSDGDTLYLYEGLIVAVADEGKVYMLTSVANALAADYSAWKEIGESTTIDIVNNLTSDRTDAALSAAQGKALAASISAIKVPGYNMVRLDEATAGYSASYQLQKDGVGVGAVIDIPKDLVVSSGSVKEVTSANTPYEGASVGDLYIELVLANTTSEPIYIPANSLVDTYTGSDYISVNGSVISLNYSSVLSQIKTDLGITDINLSELKANINKLTEDVTANTTAISNLTTEISNKADKSDIQSLNTLIANIKVKDVDTSAIGGIALTLSDEGVLGINANITTSDITLSEAIGDNAKGASLQATLSNLNTKITSAISGGLTNITVGNGLEVTDVENNSQKISLKIRENSSISVDETGLYLNWIEEN